MNLETKLKRSKSRAQKCSLPFHLRQIGIDLAQFKRLHHKKNPVRAFRSQSALWLIPRLHDQANIKQSLGNHQANIEQTSSN